MRIFKQNKLWRDKAVEIMEKNHGSRIYWRRLDDKEFDEKIKLKLLEEAHEVVVARDKKELVSELADVCEVIDSLLELHGISYSEIREMQMKKREDRGGFSERCFVEVAHHPKGSYGEKYCLADPEKYPEIIKE